MAAESFSNDLFDVKFAVPSTPADMLVRDRIAEALEKTSAKLVVVTGPAGIGKSTALAGYYEQRKAAGLAGAWIHLDPYDDGFAFWHYFCRALNLIDSNQDFAWIDEIPNSTEADSMWINRLINQIP